MTAKYELRLFNERDGMISALRNSHGSDEDAKQEIFFIRDNNPYARFELWRGTEKIAEGPRFIIPATEA